MELTCNIKRRLFFVNNNTCLNNYKITNCIHNTSLACFFLNSYRKRPKKHSSCYGLNLSRTSLFFQFVYRQDLFFLTFFTHLHIIHLQIQTFNFNIFSCSTNVALTENAKLYEHSNNIRPEKTSRKQHLWSPVKLICYSGVCVYFSMYT